MRRLKFVERCIGCAGSVCCSVYCYRNSIKVLYNGFDFVGISALIKTNCIYSKSQIEEYII